MGKGLRETGESVWVAGAEFWFEICNNILVYFTF